MKHRRHEIKKTPHIMPMDTAAPLLAWPVQLLGMMAAPLRADSKQSFPQTGSEETDKEYLYYAALPGIARDQIALYFENGAIVLEVTPSQNTKAASASIRRAFSLPVYTNGKAIVAKLKNDLLTITIPKTDKPVAPQGNTIPIH